MGHTGSFVAAHRFFVAACGLLSSCGVLVFIAECGFSLVAASVGYSFAVHRLLIAVASLVAEHGL